jgi:hypothetical protein
MKTIHHLQTALSLGLLVSIVNAQAPITDMKPAFMQITTNYNVQTRMIISTNYVATTNAVVVTNFYNAQGQLLPLVPATPPAIPGLIPIPETKPVGSDPAVVKATQQQAVRDLLTRGLLTASNNLCVAGSFTSNTTQQIQIPQGVTVFDRKKNQALLAAINLTAEKAAPGVVALLQKSAAQFQTDDPAVVIKGTSDAATSAFVNANKATWEPQILVLVQQAGTEPRLRETYNSAMLKGGGLLGAVLGSGPSVDIEAHVAKELTQAVLNQVAAQEGTIRSDVNARKTPALREAFAK